jgi:hypothetical protein
MQAIGWSQLSMMKRYLHVMDGMLTEDDRKYWSEFIEISAKLGIAKAKKILDGHEKSHRKHRLKLLWRRRTAIV